MLDNEPTGVLGDEPNSDAPKNEAVSTEGAKNEGVKKKAAPRRRAASRPAGPPQQAAEEAEASEAPAAAVVPANTSAESVEAAVEEKPPVKRARKTAAKKTAASEPAEAPAPSQDVPLITAEATVDAAAEAPKATARTRTRKKAASAEKSVEAAAEPGAEPEAKPDAEVKAEVKGEVSAPTEVSATAEPAEPVADAEAPTKPAVRTRRRAASAPAGPPKQHDDDVQAKPATQPAAVTEPAATRSAVTAPPATSGRTQTGANSAGFSTTPPAVTTASAASKSGVAAGSSPFGTTASTSPFGTSPFVAPAAVQSAAPSGTPSNVSSAGEDDADDDEVVEEAPRELTSAEKARAVIAARAAGSAGIPLFQAPDLTQAAAAKQRQQERRDAAKAARDAAKAEQAESESAEATAQDEEHPTAPTRRNRNRDRAKNRNRDVQESEELVTASTGQALADTSDSADSADETDEDDEDDEDGTGASSRRRRRRRRRTGGDAVEVSADDPPNTVVKVREAREVREPRARQQRDRSKVAFGPDDDVQGVRGSTRLEAKKQRRREGRDTGRRRAPLITEAEFLARRESVERVMVVRQNGDRTQIGVLEDGVLVEHYVNRATSASYVGNVYLGKVQNVLPSMEAAFVDIGKGRNAVLYAGEVNFDAAGITGQAKRIESVLKSGQAVLTQVTKDPMGHKGARLTSQVSLPGRYLVYVPEGTMTGISRKLPENERTRLKQILKQIVPEDAGVIVRTAAEGASEDELRRDVERLAAQWAEIQRKAQTSASSAPTLLYGEPDLTVRVVRDIFNEDFVKIIVSGDEAWDTIREYVDGVAPDLAPRLERWTSEQDVFSVHRIDEQLAKALDRKVWLPSGGSLVIDRTEAMVVVDVNTGKFTGAGGNLEETVTRNNIEAAEEIVRQLRLRDLGGIVVIDFIDMVLESNRDLVMRRLLECLGRDRTKHQVAEVTSLGLVQMTRKRVGQGLLEAFSENCDKCNGRGVLVHMEPVQLAKGEYQQQHEQPEKQHRGQKSGGGTHSHGDDYGYGSQKQQASQDAPQSSSQPLSQSSFQPSSQSAEGSVAAGAVATAAGPEEGSEGSSRSSRRKRRKAHGHLERQFDVDGISEEFRDFEDAQEAVAGPVTVTHTTPHPTTHAAPTSSGFSGFGTFTAPAADAQTASASQGASQDASASQAADAVKGEAAAAGPAVTSTAQSEAAVMAALGGSGSIDLGVGGDTAAPKKRGLRVRRAAKRPAGPPTAHGETSV